MSINVFFLLPNPGPLIRSEVKREMSAASTKSSQSAVTTRVTTHNKTPTVGRFVYLYCIYFLYFTILSISFVQFEQVLEELSQCETDNGIISEEKYDVRVFFLQ